MLKKILPKLLLAAVVIAYIAVFSLVTLPYRTVYGSAWAQYKNERRDSLDVLFFGSSLAYCNIAPAAIWEESGITSFVMAGPEQTMPMTYFYVREALKTQSPQLVLVDATAMFFKETNSFQRVNLAYMPYGINRIRATFCAADSSEWLGSLFPPYNYHSRWEKSDDKYIKAYLLGDDVDMFAGYTMLTENNYANASERKPACDDDTFLRNSEYAGKIFEYCRERGVRAVFYFSPTLFAYSGENKERIASALAEYGAELVDFDYAFEEAGLDAGQDYYDSMHFAKEGAVKFSHWLASWLKEISPRGTADAELWKERVAALE